MNVEVQWENYVQLKKEALLLIYGISKFHSAGLC